MSLPCEIFAIPPFDLGHIIAFFRPKPCSPLRPAAVQSARLTRNPTDYIRDAEQSGDFSSPTKFRASRRRTRVPRHSASVAAYSQR